MEKTNTLSFLSLQALHSLLLKKDNFQPELDPLFSSVALSAKNDEMKRKKIFWSAFHVTGAFILLWGLSYLFFFSKYAESLQGEMMTPFFVLCCFAIGFAYHKHISKFKIQTDTEFETEIMQMIRNKFPEANEKSVALALIAKIDTFISTKEEIPGKQKVIEEIVGLLSKIELVENKEIVLTKLNHHSNQIVSMFLAELKITVKEMKRENEKKEVTTKMETVRLN